MRAVVQRGGLTPAYTLTRHPSSPCAAVRGVAADVARDAGVLRVRFAVDGDLARIAAPTPGDVRPGERLWEHTCVEVFIGAPAGSAYHELNVAPSRAWQAHAFVTYRDGAPLAADALVPIIAVEHGRDGVVIAVELELAPLASIYATAPLRIGLAAVVEDGDGALSYWALAHPPGLPDFHHPDGFTVTLDAPARVAGESRA